jgi:hypothetical protein
MSESQMSDRRLLSGRTVTVLVLATLVVTVCAAVYMAMVRLGPLDNLPPGPLDEMDAEARMEAARRLTLLLSILLISSLLILLFALGAYLVIRIGRLVARDRAPLGGKPTEYVDAWRQYRLTDEQISAATSESDSAGPQAPPPANDTPDDEHEEDDPDRPPPPER